MIVTDLLAYKRYFPKWRKEVNNIEYICLLSPNKEQYYFLKELFPKSKFHISTVRDWNLNQSNSSIYDLIIACNVFHYANNPELWFANVFNSCRYFWMQDLINRYRSGLEQFGDDGDCMRYSFSPNNISDYSGSFDLSVFKKSIIAYEVYEDPPPLDNQNNKNFHFLCFMRGFQNSHNNPRMPLLMSTLHYIRMLIWHWNLPDPRILFKRLN